MKKAIVIPIIIGGVLLLAGATIFALAVANNTKDEVVTNEYVINDEYQNFKIEMSTSKLVFAKAEDTKTKVVCIERKKQYHEVKVVENALNITYKEELKWYEKLFSWDFTERKVTVYLPEKDYGDLNIKSSTGNLLIPSDFSFNSLTVKLSTGDIDIQSNVTNNTKIETSTGDIKLTGVTTKKLDVTASTGNLTLKDINVTTDSSLKASTGKINLNNFKANNLTVNVSTGRINLTDTIVNQHLEIKASTGDVTLTDSDADTIKVQTDTGDIKGTLLTDKIFYAHSDTGKVNVPKSTTGGLCELISDTGDITVSIKGA